MIIPFKVSSECITKYQFCHAMLQQTELQHCCRIEELIPRHVRTICQERAAADHNPGSNAYDMCQEHAYLRSWAPLMVTRYIWKCSTH
uniref:Uncharacterized protein n=1 Tax=Anopheles funestus TaxID=62324 RepID=A0A4Y0BKM3_ANOFN